MKKYVKKAIQVIIWESKYAGWNLCLYFGARGDQDFLRNALSIKMNNSSKQAAIDYAAARAPTAIPFFVGR